MKRNQSKKEINTHKTQSAAFDFVFFFLIFRRVGTAFCRLFAARALYFCVNHFKDLIYRIFEPFYIINQMNIR